MNGICDEDEEEKSTQGGDPAKSTTTTAATTTTTTTTTTEEDLSELNAQAGKDDTETETETDEDLEELNAQGGRDDMMGGPGDDAGVEDGQTGQLEFTHHIYEEYQPTVPVESKPPIILQTIPHYSVANYFSLSKHHHPNLPPPPLPPPSPRPVHHHHRHHTSHHVTHNVGGGPIPTHPHPGHHAHHQHTSVSHGVGGFTGPGGGLITGPGVGPGISGPGPGPGLIPGGTLAPGRIPTPGVPPPLPHHHSGGRHHFHHSSTAGPNVFAPHGLNPIPDGPFPLDIPPRQFHPMGASSSESLVKYGEGEENGDGEEDEKGNGLFYGDIQAIIRGGRPTASSSLPPLPPRQQNPRASPSSTLFDEQELSNLVSSSGGRLPVLNAGTPPSTSSPMVFNGGMSDAAGLAALGGGPGGAGGVGGNPFMYNVPLPQTIIYDQNNKPDYTPTQPPQPLLKYHLIR